MPLGRQADGNTYQVSLQTLQTVIGGGGPTSITTATSFGALVYQYGYYVALQLPATGSTANTNAMVAMCTAMAATTPNGGEAWIPQINYAINFITNGFTVADQTVMRGMGTGGRVGGTGGFSSYHFTAGGDGTLFSSAGPHSSGGTRYENMGLLASSPTLTSTCAIFGAQWNTKAVKCGIVNFPAAVVCGGLSSGTEQCTIWYQTGSPGGAAGGVTTNNGTNMPLVDNPTTSPAYHGTQPTMVCLEAPQCYVIGPGEHAQDGQNSGGPANVVGVGIGNTAKGGGGFGGGLVEHSVIANIHLSDYTWAISYCFNPGTVNGTACGALAGGSKGSNISFIEAQSWGSCVLMVAPTSGATIFDEKYTACTFQKSQHSTDPSAIVYIDATIYGGSNNNISDVEFTDCTIYNASDQSLTNCHGINIVSGSNIRILGGTIANMGNGGANINIGGLGFGGGNVSPGRVLIHGVRLAATYTNASFTNISSFAVLISQAPSQSVVIQNCVMDGAFIFAAFHSNVAIGVGQLYINNCIGYNDQNTIVNTLANVSTNTVSAYNATGAGSTAYFGASFVYGITAAAPSTLQINGVSSGSIPASSFYSFYLASPYDTFKFSAAPFSLNWTGK